ncbi:MAG TPA: FAD binding domain-containing protein [Pseudolabrys sp.]|jgi:carbon-monoxide dehydrogenase medium subunit|nr:FAD binding domain-containing protein [Pseudolabrys sp.]
MKPASFEFVRVTSVAEASRQLKQANGTARLVAGGQSLGPMLNLRLARPALLIDITGIPDLIEAHGGEDAVTVGACVTTAAIEDKRLPGRGLESLASVAMNIAYRAVRNRGTIGGSLCHADPSADWVTTLCALDAQCLIASEQGNRIVPAHQFIRGAYENALAPDEVLTAIKIPRLSARGRFGYYKVCRKAGEFASAMAAVVHDPDRGVYRAVIGATRGKPILIEDARELQQPTGKLNEMSALQILESRGIASSSARRQQLAALSRAFAQATLQ